MMLIRRRTWATLLVAFARARIRVHDLEKAMRQVRELVAEADQTPGDWQGRRARILELTQQRAERDA